MFIVSNITRHHEKLMQCKLCSYTSTNKMHFKAHVSSHKDGLYKCQDCEYQSEFVEMMKKHVDSGKHLEWECNGCNYLTRRRGKFSYHVRNCRGLMETRPSTWEALVVSNVSWSIVSMTIEASLQQTVLSEISSETIFLTMNSSGGFLNTAVLLFGGKM